MHDLFQTAPIPRAHRRNKGAAAGGWLTWSNEFRTFVAELDREGLLAGRVLLKKVPGCAPYSASYDYPAKSFPPDFQTRLLMFGTTLSGWRVRGKRWFFRDMIDPPVNIGRIRPVFAALRTALITLQQDERAALYAPVAPEKRDPGFNLHADLFLTRRLWLIFDDVPEDGTGASLFVSRADLFAALRSIKTVPRSVIGKVEILMTTPIGHNSFDRLYSILHAEHHAWHLALRSALRSKTESIPFSSGEGYLVDDREWLHGRTAVSRAVTARRFHRLAFGLGP